LSAAIEMLECDLHRVRFQGDRGFLIGVFKIPKAGDVAALGDLINPQVGARYKLHGKWVHDNKWGRQFKFKRYEKMEPQDEAGIYRYIVHTAKWVGPAIGKQLIKLYSEETLQVLREDPERVAEEVRGITKKRAGDIQRMLLENQSRETLLVELEALVGGLGLRKSLPTEIALKWKSDAITLLKKNPYILCKLENVGFLTADRIAMERLKIEKDSFNRKVAAIHYIISKNEKNGSVWIEVIDLRQQVELLVGCDVRDAITELVKRDLALDNRNFVATKSAARDETYIADKLKKMIRR